MSGFKAKKAINYELEAHKHGGLEEEDEDGEQMGVWRPKFEGYGRKRMLASDISLVGFFIKFRAWLLLVGL